jgi:glutathione peroxidase-family protein
MSIATLVLGESGTGKTCSLRNLDPSKCLLIQPVRKPLPFRSQDWKGHIYVTENAEKIISAMERTQAEVIIVDDFQYILSEMFMARVYEKGFDKFSQIAKAGHDVCKKASMLAPEKRVYILAHTQTGEDGTIRIKTIGKLLDEMLSKADPDYKKSADIKWNFTKFLVGKDGRVIRRYEPTTDIKEVEADIKNLL